MILLLLRAQNFILQLSSFRGSGHGDRASTGASYGSDHLPVFADIVLRDTDDGFAADTAPPIMALQAESITLNSPGGSFQPSVADVSALDNQDPAPVVTHYPLVNAFTNVG
ncbi:MAG: hypothetical protein ACKOFH_07480, partial [Chthoniobacterales bacterium]